jgi:hypothetical protein
MSENEKTSDIVNTTDCLEAVNAFKGLKNFLFFVVLICLLLLEAVFWLEQFGYIDKTACVCESGRIVCSDAAVGAGFGNESGAAVATIEAQAQLATEQVGTESDQPAESGEAGAKQTTSRLKFTLKCCQACFLIRACNFILIIAATLYCLALLMSIKISLVGRLGGVNHICRAFILSLFGLVLLFPWQKFFGGVVAGAIYTPQELLCSAAPTAEDSVVSQVLYYLRFVVLWLVTFLLFVFAQFRSARWAGATLRRLGMIH